MAISEKVQFFDSMEAQGLALTYDDVRMRTKSGSDGPLPDNIDITSRFSENI